MLIDPARPFLLFDDARPSGSVRAFQDASARLEAYDLADVNAVLAEARRESARGRYIAGCLAYEAGGAFEPRMAGTQAPGPLVSLGIYEREHRGDWEEIAAYVRGREAEIRDLCPQVERARYEQSFRRILEYIGAGDIYQANLTFPVSGSAKGHPLALYDRLRRTQQMPFGALMHGEDRSWVLSASPELFFGVRRGRVTARPMKGTARRRPLPVDDLAARRELAADPKNRAENLMITDLIRNDLSRIAAPGSVEVHGAFAVESYPTVHQMVTTVKAKLAEGRDAFDVLAAMFPCGSITGAPKVRAAQIIDEVEAGPRGLYTGSLCWFAPTGDACASVAIRTGVLEGKRPDAAAARFRMGVGAGIVADSRADAEWSETLDKAAFLTCRSRPFHLIETMRFDPQEGVVRLALHMMRLEASAKRLGFTVSTHAIGNLLQAATGRLMSARRVRLVLARDGTHAVHIGPLPEGRGPLRAVLSPLPVEPDDIRLYHKTSDREFYDTARRASQADEVVFVRPDGLLTEGSFTNLFVKRGDTFLTPPAGRGLLPGVLRGEMLQSGLAQEADLTPDDFSAGEVFLGNSLRGLMRVSDVARAKGQA